MEKSGECEERLSVPRQWQCARASLLPSGRDYYRILRESLKQADERICILAWDINSQIDLLHEEAEDSYPTALGPFLEALLEAKPRLHIYLLAWDYSMIYLAEREWLASLRFVRKHRDRFHLIFDNALPVGASHHEKAVIVDEVLAFCGGYDLGKWRWDTPEHPFEDERRVNPDGERYPPFHDVQMIFEGEAVRELVSRFHARWKRAGGGELEKLERRRDASLWPEGLEVDFEEVSLAFFYSQSRYREHEALYESERMHLESISAARHLLFFENQYFSSRKIMEALARRLEEKRGPEVVMILTANTDGWLEESTMGVMRDFLLATLRQRDAHGRFRAYHVQRTDGEGQWRQVYVHAKMHTVDDRLLKIGSTNLSNRSMRVDTECDVVVLGEGADERIARARHRQIALLAGLEVETVDQCLREEASFVEAMDRITDLSKGRLAAFPDKSQGALEKHLAERVELDPEEPLDPTYWVRDSWNQVKQGYGKSRLLFALIATGACVVALVVWLVGIA